MQLISVWVSELKCKIVKILITDNTMSMIASWSDAFVSTILCCFPGDVESGIEHLSNAVAVCGRAEQLLQVLQQTLPPQIFQLLLANLPLANQVRQASCGT